MSRGTTARGGMVTRVAKIELQCLANILTWARCRGKYGRKKSMRDMSLRVSGKSSQAAFLHDVKTRSRRALSALSGVI